MRRELRADVHWFHRYRDADCYRNYRNIDGDRDAWGWYAEVQA